MVPSQTHTLWLIAEQRAFWATASLMTIERRVDVCADTGECVYICDTLSQQMYVISFRGWSGEGWGGGGKREENERANERKLRDLVESGARGLL